MIKMYHIYIAAPFENKSGSHKQMETPTYIGEMGLRGNIFSLVYGIHIFIQQ